LPFIEEALRVCCTELFDVPESEPLVYNFKLITLFEWPTAEITKTYWLN